MRVFCLFALLSLFLTAPVQAQEKKFIPSDRPKVLPAGLTNPEIQDKIDAGQSPCKCCPACECDGCQCDRLKGKNCTDGCNCVQIPGVKRNADGSFDLTIFFKKELEKKEKAKCCCDCCPCEPCDCGAERVKPQPQKARHPCHRFFRFFRRR